MPNALIPELSGRRLTVDVALNEPTIIRSRIAALADDQILMDKVYTAWGEQVQGGGILYSVVKASDFFTSDVEKRAPATEYAVVEGVNPEPRLAELADWGGKFQVTDEQRDRNLVSYLDQQVTQLSNTLARKLDVAALAALEDALSDDANTVAGHSWKALKTVGPLDELTASGDLPTADFSAAQLAADLQELGVTHDLLITHPNEAHKLRVAYGDKLDAVLKSAGLSLFSNPRLTAGTAYACQKGGAGTVGFEHPLTVTTWRDEATRSTWVQGFCVPAFATERPYAVKKLTGLAS